MCHVSRSLFLIAVLLSFTGCTTEKPTATKPSVVPALPTPPASGPTWGHLKVRFVVEGDVPEPRRIDSSRVPEHLRGTLVDESLVVSKKGGLKNVVLSLRPEEGRDLPVHPDFAASAEHDVALDIQDYAFRPKIVLLRTTQKLIITNRDAVNHNCRMMLFNNDSTNPLIPPGESVEFRFPKVESSPKPLECTIHPWMNWGWILIKDDPYCAVSDAEGNIELNNLPAGEWTFRAFHERCGSVLTAKLNGELQEWQRGQFQVAIKAGETTDLGEVLVPAEALERKP
jgi:hypothetical protein